MAFDRWIKTYGCDASLHRGIRDLGLDYAVATSARALVKVARSRGTDARGKATAETIAGRLGNRAWQTITWRQGVAERLRTHFARSRVHARGESCTRHEPEEWRLIAWPKA